MSEYTAEEYREVLREIYDMTYIERKTAFGESRTTLDYIFNNSAQEIIEKYRTYINTPKTGEYWKSEENGNMVVVRYSEGNVVRYYRCDNGASDCMSVDYFTENFTKTGHKSQYLEAFLSEMKKVSE